MDGISFGEACAGDRRVGVRVASLSAASRLGNARFLEKAGSKRSVVAKPTMSAVLKLAMKIDVSPSDVVFRHGVPPDQVVPRPRRGEGTDERVLHCTQVCM